MPSASRNRQEIVIGRSVPRRRSAAFFATGQPNAGEAYHDHTTQNHARRRRLHLDIVDCRERLRTGADLGQRRVRSTICAVCAGCGLKVFLAVGPHRLVSLLRGKLALCKLLRIEHPESFESGAGVLHVVQELGVARLAGHAVGSLSVPVAKIVRYAGAMKLVGLLFIIMADDKHGSGNRAAQRL